MVGQGEMNLVEYQLVKKVVDQRKEELQGSLAKERGVVALAGSLGSPQLIAQRWKSSDLDRQRAILIAVLESEQVDKVIQRGMHFKPARLRPIWKFWFIQL